MLISTSKPLSCCSFINNLVLPKRQSHKGNNGKLLIVGGSELFHSASQWSLEVASQLVDMVFYHSTPENNRILFETKKQFRNGIVIIQDQLLNYLQEADAILIGPGMTRDQRTDILVNSLVKKFNDKKWIIDAGALQMINPILLNHHHIITPHQQEMKLLNQKIADLKYSLKTNILLKGVVDQIFLPPTTPPHSTHQIIGGNAGMTKGGTGDVLAGLVAGLYCKNNVETSLVTASYINKKAGDNLYKQNGPFFNASQLAQQVSRTLWQTYQQCQKMLTDQ